MQILSIYCRASGAKFRTDVARNVSQESRENDSIIAQIRFLKWIDLFEILRCRYYRFTAAPPAQNSVQTLHATSPKNLGKMIQ